MERKNPFARDIIAIAIGLLILVGISVFSLLSIAASLIALDEENVSVFL